MLFHTVNKRYLRQKCSLKILCKGDIQSKILQVQALLYFLLINLETLGANKINIFTIHLFHSWMKSQMVNLGISYITHINYAERLFSPQ